MRTLTGRICWCWEDSRPLNSYVAFSKQIKSRLIALQRTQTGWTENLFRKYIAKEKLKYCFAISIQTLQVLPSSSVPQIFRKCVWSSKMLKYWERGWDVRWICVFKACEAQNSTFKLKHPWDVCYDHRGLWCWKSDKWKPILGMCFPFLFITQMQFISLFWLFSHRGQRNTLILFEQLRMRGKRTHTHRRTHTRGAVRYNPFLGCVYSQAFRALLCYICTPGGRSRLIIPEKPTLYTVCVWILYVAIH